MSISYEALTSTKTYAPSIYQLLMIAPVSERAPVKLPAFLAPRFAYRLLVQLGARWKGCGSCLLGGKTAKPRDASLQMRTESEGRAMCVPVRSCHALRNCGSVRVTVEGRLC